MHASLGHMCVVTRGCSNIFVLACRPSLTVSRAEWRDRVFRLGDDKFMPDGGTLVSLPETFPVKEANAVSVRMGVRMAVGIGGYRDERQEHIWPDGCGRGVKLEIGMTCGETMREKVRGENEEEKDEDKGCARFCL